MRMTREQLDAELITLRQSHADWISHDDSRRKEFAKAFNWYTTKRGMYSYNEERELRTPTWTEVFVELGKLLAARDFRDIEGNVSELELKLEKLIRDTSPTQDSLKE